MNNFDMLAKFGADVSNFAKGVNEMQSKLKAMENSTQSSATVIGTALAGAGKVLTLGLTAPIMTMGGLAVKSAMSLETAIVGVAKTTDMAGAELDQFKKDLQNLSGTIPVTTTELANIAETAGQLGIEKEHLLGFTRTMADLGVATNLSSEEAATSLARLANITQMPQTEFDRLGSVVVELGNNLATTEKEIVEMSLRLAGTGKQVGLTEAEIMGLSGAMSSVGISAQAGGSAMSKAMQIINSEVLSGGENVAGFAKVSGMSAEQFSETWKNDPIAALDAFIGGLGEVSDSGGDVAGTLDGLGIKNMNMIDTLSRLTGASGLMTEAVDMANNAWEENTALTNEAETAYDTTANKLVIVGNKIKTLAQRVGDLLLPMVNDIIDKFSGWVDKLSELDDSQLETIIKIAGFVGAIGPVLLVLGKLIAFIPIVVKGFAAFKTGMALTGVAALKTGSMMSVLGSAFAFLASPIGIAILAIGALIAVGVLIWKNWETISAKAREIWTPISNYLSGVLETISAFFTEKWQSIKSKTFEVWNAISAFFTETIPQIIENIMQWFSQLPTRLQEKWDQTIDSVVAWGTKMKEKAIEVGSRFLEIIVEFFTDLPYKVGFFIGNTLTNVALWAVEMWNKAKETGLNFYTAITDYISKLPERIWGFLTDLYSKVTTWSAEMWAKAKETGLNFYTAVSDYISKLPERIWGFLTNLYNKASTWAINMWSKAKEAGSNFYNAVSDYISKLPERIWNYLTNLYNRVVTWSSNMWSKAKQTGSQFVSGVIEYISQLPSRIMTWLSNVISRLVGWVTNMGNKGRQAGTELTNRTVSGVSGLASKMASAGADVVKGFWNGIKNLGGWLGRQVKGFFTGIVDGAKAALGVKSPSVIFKAMGVNVDEGFVQGINKGARDVNNSMGNMINGAIAVAEKANVIPVNFSTGIAGDVRSALDNSLVVSTPKISQQTVMHEFTNHANTQPAVINLRLGNRNLRVFAEDIFAVQDQDMTLEEEYGS